MRHFDEALEKVMMHGVEVVSRRYSQGWGCVMSSDSDARRLLAHRWCPSTRYSAVNRIHCWDNRGTDGLIPYAPLGTGVKLSRAFLEALVGWKSMLPRGAWRGWPNLRWQDPGGGREERQCPLQRPAGQLTRGPLSLEFRTRRLVSSSFILS